MNSITFGVSHLAVPFMLGENVRTPFLTSEPAVTSGASEVSSTLMVALSEIIPLVYALMKVANSVLCPFDLPNLLQPEVAAIERMTAMTRVALVRVFIKLFFIL